ncbi:MAG: 3-phosphoserine/phosphohydroxythreonine transaminase [Chitinophagales bacterium]|nr:3-phosphoserine/phosphohydroxythreonine transaminase [Chitinophagales bacterium]
MKKHNFSAGPAILPQSVLEQAAAAIRDFAGTGLSLLEVSHRDKEFDAVMAEARELAKKTYGLGDDYEALFLQGGASTQFCMVPFNFLPDNDTAAYTDTGEWASKAIKEAKLFGNVNVLGSSKESNYTFIPKGYTVPNDAAYFHCTSNNTIYGTQMHEFPDTAGVPLICDMSSDLYSRVIDANRFDLIYGGAQKNLGPAGATLVLVKKSLLDKTVDRKIPSMLDYRVHIKGGSMYNTPPVFATYVCLLTLRWIESQGGLAAVEKMNREKAALLYNEIDSNPLFNPVCKVEDRSFMNVTFTIAKPELEEGFLAAAKTASLVGIKGHRSVGGFRASLYNALTLESVQALVDVMKDFAQKNG